MKPRVPTVSVAILLSLLMLSAVFSKPLAKAATTVDTMDVAGLQLGQSSSVAKRSLSAQYRLQRVDGQTYTILFGKGRPWGRIRFEQDVLSKIEFMAHLEVNRNDEKWLTFGDELQEVRRRLGGLPIAENQGNLHIQVANDSRLSLFFTKEPQYLDSGVWERVAPGAASFPALPEF